MRVPCSQENLSGKDLNEQSGENWVTAGAQRGREDEEQSVGGPAVYRIYSFQEGVGCRMPEWCQVVNSGAEQQGEC